MAGKDNTWTLYLYIMRPRNVIASLIVVIALFAVAAIRLRWFEPQSREAFDRHPRHLEYTKHALCRMDCRKISKSDIDEILQTGIIVFNKSNMQDRPCPTFALQGYTSDHENLRVIFAQCRKETKVVTCYNLQEDFECDCPGDENKYKKRN